MNDETYFLIMILFGVLFILGGIYRLLSNRYKPSAKRKKTKINFHLRMDMEKEFDDDPIINPGFLLFKSQYFPQRPQWRWRLRAFI